MIAWICYLQKISYFKHPKTAQTYRQMTGVPKSFFKEVFNPFWDTRNFVEKPNFKVIQTSLKGNHAMLKAEMINLIFKPHLIQSRHA